MKNIFITIILLISFSSCKSSKSKYKKQASSRQIITKKNTKNSNRSIGYKKNIKQSKADDIVNYAKQFEGVRYKWGGTTKSGMDCSGLVFQSFKSSNIILPRISRDIAKKGSKIQLNKVLKGDLIFFKTGNKRNSINHVGLVIAIKNNDIKFIHSTTSKGVIISGLNETYWLKAFHQARRIL